MLCLGAEFLLGLYGPEYVPYRGILLIMAVTRVCAVVNLVYANVINAKGEGRKFFGISVSTVLLQISILVILVGPIGVEAMALSRLGAVLLGNVLTVLAVRKLGALNAVALRLAARYMVFAVGVAALALLTSGPMAVAGVAVVLAAMLATDGRELWKLRACRSGGV